MDFKVGENSFQTHFNVPALENSLVGVTQKMTHESSCSLFSANSSNNNASHASSQPLSLLSLQQNQNLSSIERVTYPAYDKNVNYFHEFWRMYLENEVIVSQMKEYVSKAREIQAKIIRIQEMELDANSNAKKDYIKKKRRHANEIEKSYVCPYKDCHRSYGSEVSLNLHIKLKHNGGNKTERERLAKIIIEAKLKNKKLPEINLNLPPGFLENLNLDKILRHKDKERDKTKPIDDILDIDTSDDIYKMASLASIDLPNLLSEISKAIEIDRSRDHDSIESQHDYDEVKEINSPQESNNQAGKSPNN